MPDTLEGPSVRSYWPERFPAVRSKRLLTAVSAVAIAVYVLAFTWAATHVTFYWDDYFLVLTLEDRGLLGSMLTGINGNWWPLATPLLQFEVAVFGTWYPGYLAVNALLIAVSSVLLGLAVRRVGLIRPWAAMVVAVVYATSLAAVVNATVITVSWPLSVMLALAAAITWIDRRAWWVASGLLLLSLLSQSGMFASNAAIAGALVLAARSRDGDAWRFPPMRDIAAFSGVVVAGLLGSLVGYLIATKEPINYYTVVPSDAGGGLLSALTSTPLTDAVITMSSFVTAWTATPLLPGSLLLPQGLPWLVILVQTYGVLVVLMSLVVVVTAAVVLTKGRRDGLGWTRVLPLFILLLPVVLIAGVLTLTRTGSGLAPRYGLLWLLPVLAFWAVATSPRSRFALLRIGSRVAQALVVASAILGVVLLPVTIRSAMDVDKARWDSSVEQRRAIDACLETGSGTSSDQVAPGLTDEDFCRAVLVLAG